MKLNVIRAGNLPNMLGLAYLGLSVAGILLCTNAWAHTYIDLGIESVSFDKDCHLSVAIRNNEGSLPDGFYYYDVPVTILTKKGSQTEQTQSLTTLDLSKRLASNEQLLVVKSQQRYANIQEPVTVSLEYGQEYGDYDRGNNSVTRSMDCELGKGEIEGAPIIYTHPDVAILRALVEPKTCNLQLDLENITSIALDESAWLENGVTLMIKNTESSEIIHKIPLNKLDPKQAFTRKSQHLNWQSSIELRNMQEASIAVWYVTGDSNFRNNSLTFPLPESCHQDKDLAR